MWRSVLGKMFWRLFASFGLLMLVAIGLLGWITIKRVEEYFQMQIEESLRTKAILVREAVRDMPAGQPARWQDRMVAMRQEIATRITLLAEDGRVLAESERDPEGMTNHLNRLEVQQARVSGVGASTRQSGTLEEHMVYFALRTDLPGDVAFVRMALPLDRLRGQFAELRRLIWTAVLVTGLAALFLAFWLARHVTRPLQELTSGAERIAAGNYGHKVCALARDEFGILARAFNHMSERLASQFALLEEDRQQLRTILSSMVEGVVALDADHRILFANEPAGRLLELSPQEAAGRKFWEVVRHRALQEVVRHALQGPDPFREELKWHGTAVESLTVQGVPLPGSPPRGAVLVIHDTTELRRLERLRQEFVANVSHELKTPLSVIQVAVETLQDGAIDDMEHRGRFLEQIAEQAERLHALILDLISLARIEAGTGVFELEKVPLVAMVNDCLERHRARAEGKKQQLQAQPPPGGEEEIFAWADEEAMGQILDNLVDNALKYTPEGGRILVRWRAFGNQVCLEVEDTGIGIPPQDLPRIFERFYRVDKARSRELGGTGLGLSIVKHLAQSMHGGVRAASQEGQGTSISVFLPRPPLV